MGSYLLLLMGLFAVLFANFAIFIWPQIRHVRYPSQASPVQLYRVHEKPQPKQASRPAEPHQLNLL